MHLNKISSIWTLAHVAAELGEDEDWLFDSIDEMEPEDGAIRVYGQPLGKDGTVAFSAFGAENLRKLIDIHKANRS
ncbi:MAG: hypothetical protein FP825_00820 [Hyphomonas sp.]|jgi:hypothetical protein|uniref:hypothetical protein n=1 Tax=Hyphomonas sp. TaxID=87 RepID=UPI0017D0EE4C|nr:hypothetical protein [Hyphomonas sp.]MBA3067006.1 hypothetical protein [Hyphomonas sp.]MBU4062293.1 hypothetical protein [Alphaproteobacteria bacterium]MBU4163200.1 hypothetical protein [Alphaproteobacteria bacterium]MDP3459810.1 hypothetical protein [Hyphomonas sp.]